ncbi:MAG: PstS family phosphate ABC transporter substrate-binding protein [Leptolyngbyaceae cyanobacterium SM1_1_3]|nr:PstS family phosphate ABC transporter substrate-binding protein [Leptolyngbyaceae cyanobacterium SM1_1_3]NJN02098.1 PstS family phosphate ABC transporter substrate-binding protein [Leptolyngbyaceae cyanobacterium RM1_1_2]NJO09707.1 PstS family phosphate ABC transporter substrate-binding protein [Leptolyngbyaceae cyanobacterium SL_1_1]
MLNRRVFLGAAAVAATLGIFTTSTSAQDRTEVLIDGSSTVGPISEAMAEEFIAENPDISVVVGISGTGGGFNKFCAGETVISNASRPIKESEKELCAANGIEYVEVPVAYDALTVVVPNSNTWASSLTVEELKTMWEAAAEGTITNWNQIRPSFPNQSLVLFGPGTDSGTFDYFGEVIIDGDSRADYTASEDDNVIVLGTAGTPGALGYFGLAYYEENQDTLQAVAIDNGDGPVLPSAETVNDGTYQPLSRPIFMYVRKDALAQPAVASFVDYYLSDEHRNLITEVGYVPLPDEAYALVEQLVDAGITGSVFSGAPADSSVVALLETAVNSN